MNIVAISGSLRAASTNTALVRAAVALAPDGMNITLYDGMADLPHYSPELDGVDPPAPVQPWRALLQEADGALICTPEYAFGMPGSLKNALDWIVSSGELWRKPVVALSASPSALGGEKAHAALLLTLTALEAQIVEAGSLCIPFSRTKLDTSGAITDAPTAQTLRASLDALACAINAMKAASLNESE